MRARARALSLSLARADTWTELCSQWSNNAADKGGVSSCKAHAIPTKRKKKKKIPGDFSSKEVVIFMGARFKLSLGAGDQH